MSHKLVAVVVCCDQVTVGVSVCGNNDVFDFGLVFIEELFASFTTVVCDIACLLAIGLYGFIQFAVGVPERFEHFFLGFAVNAEGCRVDANAGCFADRFERHFVCHRGVVILGMRGIMRASVLRFCNKAVPDKGGKVVVVSESRDHKRIERRFQIARIKILAADRALAISSGSGFFTGGRDFFGECAEAVPECFDFFFLLIREVQLLVTCRRGIERGALFFASRFESHARRNACRNDKRLAAVLLFKGNACGRMILRPAPNAVREIIFGFLRFRFLRFRLFNHKAVACNGANLAVD